MKFAILHTVPGCWRLEGQCGNGCGHVTVMRGTHSLDPEMPAMRERLRRVRRYRRFCPGIYMGRPRNRCGWPVSWVWIFVPVSK